MIQKHLFKIKLLFTGAVAFWLIMIVFITKNDLIGTQVSLINRQADYLIYKTQFNDDIEGLSPSSVGAALVGVFKQPETARAVASGPAAAVPALVYHGLIDTADRFSTTPENFKDQMFALKRAGYETVKVDDFIAFMKGERQLPEKSFLLTFDDGRVDSYEKADPVLKTLGWSAVMFVATGQSFVEGDPSNYYINERQAKQMSESGRWEIESHAVQKEGGFITINELGDKGNFLSSKVWLSGEARLETDDEYRQRVMSELSQSRVDINRVLSRNSRAFSYPFSDYGNQTINAESVAEAAVREAVTQNYEVAFRQTWDVDNYFTWNYLDEDLYRLRRIETPSLWNGEQLLAYMQKTEPKALPYDDTLTEDNGWKTSWGRIFFDEKGIHLAPSSSESTGSFALLDGTRSWRDYRYSVEAERDAGGYLTLYARYQSDSNFVSCTFGDGSVKIEERVEGNTRILAESSYQSPTVSARYGIEANGSDVTCTERQNIAATGSGVTTKLSSGGIGFRIWNQARGISSLNLTNLRAEAVGDSLNGTPVNTQ
jgi:peptidoglycan/xylan/chitin deacetylase (PgdA/CDA1 family)